MTPVLCMITDRSRYHEPCEDALVERVAAAARAGVHLVQVRERDLEARALLALTRRCVEAVRGTPARVIVNERVDVALAAGAHGVHLRRDSLPAARVRPLVPRSFLIGRSVDDDQDAVRQERGGGVDYVLFGTVFASQSKPGRLPAGVAALGRVVAATALPVLAVGGVTAERAAELAEAGVAGLAAIGLFAAGSRDHVAATLRAMSREFDTYRRVS